jgi:anti-anti-sigma factor
VSVDLRAGRVRVIGELDRSCAHHLLDALTALTLTAHPVWTLDGAAITFCDTAGLRALARAQVLAASGGRAVRVADCPPFLVHLLGLAGLDHLLADEPEGPERPERLERPPVVPCPAGARPAVRVTVRSQAGRAPRALAGRPRRCSPTP